MTITTLEQFYQEISLQIPEEVGREIGHFNLFDIGELAARARKGDQHMPYNRRSYFKISLMKGRNRVEYADRVIEVQSCGLLFATPKVPYHYLPQEGEHAGQFCIFTADFLCRHIKGLDIDALPIFRPGAYPVFELGDAGAAELEEIFRKIGRELASDYVYKYDLIRNYLMELIHYGQKLQPTSATHPPHQASARVASLFAELLERQFPIESPQQRLVMRTAKDYADGLSIHVNHLNKMLKEHSGHTTTSIIASRILREARILLRQTDWTVSEIAWSLGFGEVAHFSNFFKKQSGVTPQQFRA